MGDNESIVSDSDPKSSDIEVSSVGSSEVSNDQTDFGDELDDNGPNTVNDVTVTANANIPNWTTNFTDTTTEPFTQDSVPPLCENFALWQKLQFLQPIIQKEIFSDINDHTNNYVIFK